MRTMHLGLGKAFIKYRQSILYNKSSDPDGASLPRVVDRYFFIKYTFDVNKLGIKF